jgi:hypothetical protein
MWFDLGGDASLVVGVVMVRVVTSEASDSPGFAGFHLKYYVSCDSLANRSIR